jgi:hypothetical protein
MKTNPRHEALYQEFCEVGARYERAGIDPLEILAVLSKFSGRLIACLDPTKVTPDMAMKVVSMNLEAGNHEMVQQLQKAKQN